MSAPAVMRLGEGISQGGVGARRLDAVRKGPVFYRYGVAGIARFVERRVARHCLVMRRVIVVAVPGDGNDREGHGSERRRAECGARKPHIGRATMGKPCWLMRWWRGTVYGHPATAAHQMPTRSPTGLPRKAFPKELRVRSDTNPVKVSINPENACLTCATGHSQRRRRPSNQNPIKNPVKTRKTQ